MDIISDLPPEILHEILSHLSIKTTIWTSVLSKTWLIACSMNPHLNFHIYENFQRWSFGSFYGERLRLNQFYGKFLKFIDTTLERYLRENLHISTFRLYISYQSDVNDRLDKWVDIVTQKRVSHFALLLNSIFRGNYSERYSLSDAVFAMESLQHLDQNHCKILLKQEAVKCHDLKDRSNFALCYCL